MPDERPYKRSPGTGSASEQPWCDCYDMSHVSRSCAPTYSLSADPHSGITLTALPVSGAPQRLAMLQVWSSGAVPTSHDSIIAPANAASPQAEYARDTHLKVMGELTVSIAHEICQPLLAIASNAAACMRWLQRDRPNLEEAISGLADIRSDCERAAGIVAALRALAKQSPCAPQPVNVNDLILEAVRLHTPALSQHAITLDVKLDADQSVIADPVQIQQLVYNLIANAIEAIVAQSMTNGVLRVSSKTLRDGVQVSVEDNGPGIAVEARQQIFEAFYTTKNSGLGMGLTICRSVVEAHKGNLYAEASELGGAMVRFQLPTGCLNH